MPDRPIIWVSQEPLTGVTSRIWMDTLCIPALHPTQYTEQRKAAIAKMRTIYTETTSVLVLDAELLQACEHVSNLELMIRVVTSAWMRRVWTLQEGVLTEAIYVQFKERAINLNQVEGWLQHNLFAPRGQREFMNLEASMAWSRMKKAVKTPKPKNIELIYDVLRYRETTYPTDEAVCLAVLAGEDPQSILSIVPGTNESMTATADRRMQEFLRLCRRLPMKLLFVRGERFNDKGYRWAPKSFIPKCTRRLLLSTTLR